MISPAVACLFRISPVSSPGSDTGEMAAETLTRAVKFRQILR